MQKPPPARQTPTSLDYKRAGVDIQAGNAFIERIKPLCAKTTRAEVISGVGGFGGLFKLSASKYQSPVLVSATDGVGTKVKFAAELGEHDNIGIDLVAMCVNDILTHGAEPLFFLDYFACGKLFPDIASKVVASIAHGCKLAKCALIGGETAEMPDVYNKMEYDLAGFAVGVADESALCGKHKVQIGDAIIALASNGVHSNGFSLIRKIINESHTDPKDCVIDDTKALWETLLAPTHIYVCALLPAIKQNKVHALAHITGGGLSENIPRILNENQAATVNLKSWDLPPVFEWIRKTGHVEKNEMRRVFNCGVGMAIVVAPKETAQLIEEIEKAGFDAWKLGEITERREPTRAVIYEGD